MATVNLREYLDARETEIREIRSNLLKELREIRKAKAAIDTEAADESSATSSETSDSPDLARSKYSSDPGLTIKQMVVEVLEEYGKPATSETIKQLINSKYSKTIARESLSPQLSRLRRLRSLSYDRELGLWSLRDADRLSD